MYSLTIQLKQQLVAIHSPATAKNLRKTRKLRKKLLHIASPKKSSPSKSTTAKYVFLSDPTKKIMLQLNQNHLPPLINNEYLCTQTIDYLIQRAIN
jgi:hypothetical protein